jgi:hypothetical protein
MGEIGAKGGLGLARRVGEFDLFDARDRTFMQNDVVLFFLPIHSDYNLAKRAGRNDTLIAKNQKLWPDLSQAQPLSIDVQIEIHLSRITIFPLSSHG